MEKLNKKMDEKVLLNSSRTVSFTKSLAWKIITKLIFDEISKLNRFTQIKDRRYKCKK